MTPLEFRQCVILPGAVAMKAAGLDVPQGLSVRNTITAMDFLLAVAIQESGLAHRRQVGGPARGWWQFEGVNGGAGEVLSMPEGLHLCQFLRVKPLPAAVMVALEFCDLLSYGFARLLLWSDPHPVPSLYQPDEAWQCYLRTWRPGKPSRERWEESIAAARNI